MAIRHRQLGLKAHDSTPARCTHAELPCHASGQAPHLQPLKPTTSTKAAFLVGPELPEKEDPPGLLVSAPAPVPEAAAVDVEVPDSRRRRAASSSCRCWNLAPCCLSAAEPAGKAVW